MVVTSGSKGYSVHGECDNGVQLQFHNQVKKGTQCKGSHLSNGGNLCGIMGERLHPLGCSCGLPGRPDQQTVRAAMWRRPLECFGVLAWGQKKKKRRRRRRRRYVYIYIHIHTHTYIYMYIYAYPYLYVLKDLFILGGDRCGAELRTPPSKTSFEFSRRLLHRAPVIWSCDVIEQMDHATTQ